MSSIHGRTTSRDGEQVHAEAKGVASDPMNERERRIGLNEAVFRQVNEQITGLADRFGLEERELDLICECGEANCVERISMPPAAYEALRADPTRFAVYPGHDQPDVERVVEKGNGYEVVEKHAGAPSELAQKTDPRGG
jgi:hypothetical protein